jgi:sugar O-acyltransferase (sialic acid O-acetyltransferase NeuD family)
VIIGAGGFGREVHDIVVAINQAAPEPVWDFLGFLDDGEVPLDRLERIGARLLGTAQALPEYAGASYVVGVGDPKVRELLADRADAAGLQAAVLIHPSATIGLDVEIGEGSVLCSHVSITTNIRLGRHVHLNLNCTVGHDVTMEDFVSVFPGATISGDVVLERGVTVGTGAAVIQGLRVGAGAVVGAGAAVVRDVGAGETVVGVPARMR